MHVLHIWRLRGAEQKATANPEECAAHSDDNGPILIGTAVPLSQTCYFSYTFF